MGTLKSSKDWTGRDIDGIVLGIPARDDSLGTTGFYYWDGPGIPTGMIDDDGDIWEEVDPNAIKAPTD